LHRWADDDEIGGSMTGGADEHRLVLVVRGELLRRFPNSMLFAERAHVHPVRNRLEPDGTVRWPLFQGEIEPDVHFAGFDLTEEEARGDSPGDDGWYVVIQEQPTHGQFGLDVAVEYADTLDPVVTWDDLSWGHLATENDFDGLRYISLGTDLPDTSQVADPGAQWGSNAAEMAHILLQKPTRIAVHARVMLPELEDDDD
jgi:hypothetical protein